MKADGLTRVRAIAMKLANVEEGTTYGYPAFKVRGKPFAWFPKKAEVDEGSLGVRMSILEREHRIQASPALFYVTPHYKDYPCALVRIDKMSASQLREVLESSHEFMAAQPKRR